MSSPTQTKDGLVFGPNSKGNRYIAMYYHRQTRNPNKSLWDPSFTVVEEYELFNLSDVNNWSCQAGNKWGILDDGRRKLGSDGQRISFCPSNGNPQDPWHGYPVSTVSMDYAVPEEVLQLWETNKVVSSITARRIRSAKL